MEPTEATETTECPTCRDDYYPLHPEDGICLGCRDEGLRDQAAGL